MITPLLFQQKGNGVLCPDKALAKCNKQIVLITKNSRFPGASQNEINSNIISSATTEVEYISSKLIGTSHELLPKIAFYSSDDFNFDYLADYLDEVLCLFKI